MLLQAAARLRVASTRHFSTAVSSSARAAAVDASHRRIYSLFHNHGNSDYIGEPMSITEHSVQTALAAKKAGEAVEVQLACLLHDVGHLAGLEAGHAPGMDGCGTEDHEAVGADFLAALGLPDTVSYLARHHVDAKRYLCAVDSEYHARLSDASRTTLKHQGGPMSAAEPRSRALDASWRPAITYCMSSTGPRNACARRRRPSPRSAARRATNAPPNGSAALCKVTRNVRARFVIRSTVQ